MASYDYMKGEGNKAIVKQLTTVLADTFVLYFKTHAFHWNVVGPEFKSLHELFEVQYTELWTSTDEIAERIRSLDNYAPLTMKDILAAATLKEAGQMPDAMGMVKILEQDNMAIVDSIHKLIDVCEEHGDEGTIDIMNKRSQVHESAAWMLRSILR